MIPRGGEYNRLAPVIKNMKKTKYCKCGQSNLILHMGGEFVEIQKDGLKVTRFKGKKPTCMDCDGVVDLERRAVVQSIKDILWMARRYANMRQTYAVSSFNDAYDILRDHFGDGIDSLIEDKAEHPDYPYATDGGGDTFNRDIKNRKYAKTNNKRKLG